MTERIPEIPYTLENVNQNVNKNLEQHLNKQNPNPRTVRATDMTWFNTSGTQLIKTDYNKCSNKIESHMYPWGILSEPRHNPFNLQEWGTNNPDNQKCNLFTRFDLYGLHTRSDTGLNRCGYSNAEFPYNNSNYVNPN